MRKERERTYGICVVKASSSATWDAREHPGVSQPVEGSLQNLGTPTGANPMPGMMLEEKPGFPQSINLFLTQWTISRLS
jgi:hypothetical protein